MELVWFELEGYKRFAELSKVNVDGKLVAIVGPNEAGKSTLLSGLLHLNDTTEFVRDGASQEITRGKNFENEHVVAEYTFVINDEDRVVLLVEVPEATNTRLFAIRKTVAGTFHAELKDPPRRNLGPRAGLAAMLRKSPELARGRESTGEDDQIPLEQSVLAVLASANESLKDEELDILREYVQQASECDANNFAGRVSELIAYESRDHPEKTATSILRKRRPKILFFSDDDRELLSEYDLNSFYREENPRKNIRRLPVPAALCNLASTANLDLVDLHDAQAKTDAGRIRTILEKANDVLSQRLQETWQQSRLSVSIDLNQWRLTVLIRSEKGDYVQIAERSDGLRQFVALLMFLSQEPNLNVAPIVLVDEAERHLHYDAQADLIQMFTRQNAASKIIYTTHSIGCLPEDLGAVRMVAADDPHSTIVNWFWDSDTPGFSPLLFAMGASTLAFVAMRYAVIAEGAADMILVPALLTELLGIDELGFQVAPGLASSDGEGIAVLDNQSPRTAYLVDTDESGKNIRRRIKAAGVPGDRIVDLPDVNGEGHPTVIEDFIEPSCYVAAINGELRRSHGDRFAIATEDVNGPNMPKLVQAWCNANAIGTPSKRSVAYRLVEARRDGPFVRATASDQLSELYAALRRALQLD